MEKEVLTILGFVVVAAIILYDSYRKVLRVKEATPKNDYKRWSEDEIFVCAYIAVFTEDEERLNDNFQFLLADSLQRTERAVYEKIRRLMTIGVEKSDATELDIATVLDIAAMEDEDALEQVEARLKNIGLSNRRVQDLLSYIS